MNGREGALNHLPLLFCKSVQSQMKKQGYIKMS